MAIERIPVNRLIEALAQICKQHPLVEKWLIVPSLRVGHQWVQAMTRGGQPAVNLHIKSLKGMVLALAGPEMARTGAELLSSQAGGLVIAGILHRLRDGDLQYLGRLEPSVGLAQAVHRSIIDV